MGSIFQTPTLLKNCRTARDTEINSALGYAETLQYLVTKHGLTHQSLDRVNLPVLQRYLQKFKIHQRANIVKLINSPLGPNLCIPMLAGSQNLPLLSLMQLLGGNM